MNEQTPHYYSDVFSLRTNPWGIAVTFALASPKEGIPDLDACIVRLSHETAKTLSMMIRKQLKTYERDTKTSIAIPNKVLNDLELAPEDW